MHFNTKIRLILNNWIRGSYESLTDYYNQQITIYFPFN
jgi:hypothetical protein